MGSAMRFSMIISLCVGTRLSPLLRGAGGIGHIGKLLPALLFHPAATPVTQRKVAALLLSILGLPAGGDHEIIGLAATEGLLQFREPGSGWHAQPGQRVFVYVQVALFFKSEAQRVDAVVQVGCTHAERRLI